MYKVVKEQERWRMRNHGQINIQRNAKLQKTESLFFNFVQKYFLHFLNTVPG